MNDDDEFMESIEITGGWGLSTLANKEGLGCLSTTLAKPQKNTTINKYTIYLIIQHHNGDESTSRIKLGLQQYV
jgi:hypothetical protein